MMITVLGEYDDKQDYVGPQKTKWLLRLIPRFLLLLCDINVVAYIHDYFYHLGGDRRARAEVDGAFLGHMFMWIELYDWPGSRVKYIGWILTWKMKQLAKAQALYYYMFVRLFAKGAFGTK